MGPQWSLQYRPLMINTYSMLILSSSLCQLTGSVICWTSVKTAPPVPSIRSSRTSASLPVWTPLTHPLSDPHRRDKTLLPLALVRSGPSRRRVVRLILVTRMCGQVQEGVETRSGNGTVVSSPSSDNRKRYNTYIMYTYTITNIKTCEPTIIPAHMHV